MIRKGQMQGAAKRDIKRTGHAGRQIVWTGCLRTIARVTHAQFLFVSFLRLCCKKEADLLK